MVNNKRYLRETSIFFVRHAFRRWYLLLPIIFLISLSQVFDVQVSVAYKNLVNILTHGVRDGGSLYAIVFTVFLLSMGRWVSWRIIEGLANFWQPDAIREIGEEGYKSLFKHSYDFFINNFVGSLVKRMNRLPDSFERVTDIILFRILPTFVLVLYSIYTLYQVSTILALILFIFLVVFITANIFFAIYKLQYDNMVNVADTRWSGFLADTISNSSNIHLFSTQLRELNSFKRITLNWRKIATLNWTISSVGNAIQALLMVFVEVAFVVVGIEQWEKGLLTVGDFLLFQSLLGVIFTNVWDFGKNVRQMSKGFADAEEMITIMNTPYEVTDMSGAKPLRMKDGEIDITNLYFCYPNGREVFSEFSLNIPAKKKIALVSRSGEGKTTLTKLIMRLYNVPESSIFIDGQDITKVTLHSLRRSISFVPQEPILFHRTLRENITYGKPDATMSQVISAAKKAQCHGFISNLKDGYDTFVGERGVKLSGGERQRVAIARAILEDCPIIILDEATSSLDSESEHYIKKALKELMKNKTAIVIAHRLSTINQMDEIIVLEKGKITERGTHKELLAKDIGHYKNLWKIQSGGYDNGIQANQT